ncbi:MAG: hypothetical protein D6805_01490 [Planctomycetota bacterium]|nr:MAG: hypothetical protein D6805_01490 [Planctomycetota bacterium]
MSQAGFVDRVNALRWLATAVFSLAAAGILSLVLVLGRLPFTQRLISPDFARKCLVIHVNLALGIWFSCILCALIYLLPVRNPRRRGFAPVFLTWLGLGMLFVSAFLPSTRAVISNYVPVLGGSVLFFLGLGLVVLGVLGVVGNGRLVRVVSFQDMLWREGGGSVLPCAAVWGIRVAVLSFCLGLVGIGLSYMYTPSSLSARVYYELLFWGGGHIFQFANVATAISVWWILLWHLGVEEVWQERVSFFLFFLFLLPIVLFLRTIFYGTTSPLYYQGAIDMMRWGICPVATPFLLICFWLLLRRVGTFRSFAASATITSLVLMLTSFILGFLITASDTLIPAHYHASLGSITVAYMGLIFCVLEWFGYRFWGRWQRRLAFWQPVLYGGGQFIFAVGFGYARMLRKVYGYEQQITTFSQYIGLVLMGVGGLFAILGGVLFFVLLWQKVRGEFFEGD